MIVFIPGWFIALLTFPGVILHEMAHKFFCDIYHIPVYHVSYFTASSRAGHVIHENVADARQRAIISLAPLLVNSVVALLFLSPWLVPLSLGTHFLSTYTRLDLFLFWVGLSCGFNALPSKIDLMHVEKDVSVLISLSRGVAKILNFLEPAGGLLWLGVLYIIFRIMFFFLPL